MKKFLKNNYILIIILFLISIILSFLTSRLLFPDYQFAILSEDGKDYITIYFERPNAEGFFDSAQLDFPGSDFEKIKGFSNEDLEGFRFYVERSGKTALQFSREEANAKLS